MRDRSSEIVHLAAAVLDAARSALDKSEPYLEETDKKPDIAYELLIMLNSADDLVEVFDPPKEAGEYFGLLRHMTMLEENLSWSSRMSRAGISDPGTVRKRSRSRTASRPQWTTGAWM